MQTKSVLSHQATPECQLYVYHDVLHNDVSQNKYLMMFLWHLDLIKVSMVSVSCLFFFLPRTPFKPSNLS